MNRPRLFFISCLALTTTAVAFSMRGDALDGLRADFHLTNEQIGVALSPAFWGNTIAILIGGALADYFGMKRLLQLSSLGYVAAPLLIIFAPRPASVVTPYYSAPGFLCLFGGMLLLGLSQGLVEAAINPLIAALYSGEKTHRFSLLHAWWPGGLILGGLVAYGLTKMMGLDLSGIAPAAATFGWQVKIATILIPAVVYGLMVSRETLPPTERASAGVSTRQMFGEALRPMFLLMFVCMCMTSSSELGPDQWVGPLIGNLTGMRGILILVYTAGIMFVLRFFVAGRLTRMISPIGLLTISAALTAVGLFALAGVRTPAQAFLAATVFGVGKAFFWPTMLGVTAERFPRGGALLLAIMGGAGNLAAALILPLMGGWYDQYGAATAFRSVAVMPLVLTLILGALTLHYRRSGGYTVVHLDVPTETA
jgi:MFS family permease